MAVTAKTILIETARTLKIVGMIAIVIAGVIVAVFASFVWWSSTGVFSTSKFNSSAWFVPVTNNTETSCYRGGMARDIKNRLLKQGMSSSEVERLLGRPDSKSENEYRYVLGMCSGLGWDYDDLHVYFDKQGRVESAAIIQH